MVPRNFVAKISTLKHRIGWIRLDFFFKCDEKLSQCFGSVEQFQLSHYPCRQYLHVCLVAVSQDLRLGDFKCTKDGRLCANLHTLGLFFLDVMKYQAEGSEKLTKNDEMCKKLYAFRQITIWIIFATSLLWVYPTDF